MKNPGSIKAADGERISTIADQYPYFVPARYLSAAISHKAQPFNAAMLASIYPYQGNWLQLCDMLGRLPATSTQSSTKTSDEPAIVTPVVEVIVETVVETLQAQPIVEQAAAPEEEIVIVEAVVEVVNEEQVAEEIAVEEVAIELPTVAEVEEELILPVYTEDYFRQQGVKVPDEIPAEIEQIARSKPHDKEEKEDQSLMVVMSFAEWLLHFKNTAEKQREEQKDQKALKTMWQKEKLAAAMEEENEEIPENVFEMAVKSISREDGLASESLADVYIKQKKYDKAIEMYRKLSLQNPKKSTYFASKIEEILKEKQS
jgi:tetratricopeptide (TPR) repeat protein